MPTRPLAAKNVQLMTEGEVLQFHNRLPRNRRASTEAVETHELKHVADSWSLALCICTPALHTPLTIAAESSLLHSRTSVFYMH